MSAGDYELEDTVYLPFTTRAFATGIPTVLAGTPVVEIYEDASVTQITAAETLTVSIDSVVGFNMCSVAATAANGFGNGQSYTAIISTGTVGGVSVVGEVIGHFTIGMSAAFLRLGAPAGASVSADIAVIEGQTDDIGVAGAGLTAINLPNQTMDITGNITGNLSGSVGSVTAGVSLAGTATSAQLVDDVWDEVLTGGTHNVVNSAGRRLRVIQEAGGYLGAVWIDTVNGTAGTTDFENGVDTLPVDTIASANTIAASVGLSRFEVAPGSTITFAASQQNQVFNGDSWTLALGSQNIDGTSVMGASVSGIATNTAGRQYFVQCVMGAVTLPGDTHVISCGISGTQTVGEAGDYFYDSCHSGIAGTATPVLDFAAVGATNMSFRHYSGGIEVQNMTALDTMSLEGNGQVVFNANCTGGAISIRGNFTITDNAGGAITVTESANNPSRFDGVEGATFATGTDSLEAIRDRGDAAWTTGAGGSAPTVVEIRQEMDANSTQLAAIVADTNELQGDWVNGGRLDLILDARASQTSVDTIDTNVDAILVDTGTDIPARFDGIEGATFATGTDSLEAIRNRGDAAWTTGSGTGLTPLASGTAQAGAAGTIQLAAASTFANDELNGNTVKITSGTGAGQSRVITDYVGATDTATVTPNWTTNPDATSVYEVVDGSVNLTAWLGATATALETSADVWTAGTRTLTAGTNLNDLSAAQVNAEVDTALADYDGPTNAEMNARTLLAANYFDPAADTVANVTLVGTTTTNTDMRGTDGVDTSPMRGTDSALLAASAPTNFGDMAITVTTGQVTVGTNNDKTGYALTQSFPANFADFSISATTGRVDIGFVIGDPIIASSGKTTNWGGTP